MTKRCHKVDIEGSEYLFFQHAVVSGGRAHWGREQVTTGRKFWTRSRFAVFGIKKRSRKFTYHRTIVPTKGGTETIGSTQISKFSDAYGVH